MSSKVPSKANHSMILRFSSFFKDIIINLTRPIFVIRPKMLGKFSPVIFQSLSI